jgi:hypothetical protein
VAPAGLLPALALALAAGGVGRLDAISAAPSGQSPVPPPPGATVLFSGRDLSDWVHPDFGAPARWRLVDGAMEVAPGTGDIRTKAEFQDFQLHVEFNVPLMPNARGQARGNSGVYLQGRYEIQVLDSYGLTPGEGDCGALYGFAPPLVNACRPPEQWQTYDVLFHAARFDAAGKVTDAPRVSVLQNNLWIHDNVVLGGRSAASLNRDRHQAGPILLQDHGNRVRFRNIWIRPLGTVSGRNR